MSEKNLKRAHYMSLDGLRGVAALVVVWYHIFEAFATSPLDQHVNHGYLAVDFFFLLSGFVLSYSYDEPRSGVSILGFIKRRLIRLHPMLIIASIIGGIMFYTQSTPTQDLSLVPVGVLLLSVLMSILMIPVSGGQDVRGYGEMFPLNGPSWSLFFEYIGSLFYVFVLRRLPRIGLYIFVLFFAFWTICTVVTSEWNYIGSGWSMSYDHGFWGGLARVLTSMTLGVFLSRCIRPIKLKGAFYICALLLVILLGMPRLGGSESMWINGVYELVCVLAVFPLMILVAASEGNDSPRRLALCKWLGDISYPLYIIHYPFIYLYIAWVKTHNLSFADSSWAALLLFFGSIALAQILLKAYDLPVRRWLTRKIS